MIKFAICDDDPFMKKEISDVLSEYMEEKRTIPYSISCFSNGRSLLESGCGFDLIFLDIKMAKPNGIETAEMLRRRGNHSLLVFLTVLKDYVFDAFSVQAYDYLLKPLEKVRFRQTMDRAVKDLEQRGFKKNLLIQKGTACWAIPLSQILYCEVQGRKMYIHQKDGTILDYYDRLETLEKRIDGRFFRCHRSYLVNLEYVRGCEDGQVVLSQGGKIPVSRLRQKEFIQEFLRYMAEKEF